MKIKLISLLCLFAISIFLTSCTLNNDEKVTLIVPSGTPSLGVSNAIDENYNIDAEIVIGSDALISAFTTNSHDIIIAPVNLGAKLYNSINNFQYAFYRTIVGGCFYLVSTNPLLSIKDLNNQNITVFGKNSTPDVLIRSLINYYNLNITIDYVDDVSSANSLLLTEKVETILSAEPSISKFNGNKKYYTINLQQEWQQMSSSTYEIPQAGIFVKKSKLNNPIVMNTLEELNKSILLSNSSPEKLAEKTMKVDETLNKLGKQVLINAIPKCNFMFKSNKDAIEYYFNKIKDLKLQATFGGDLPNEDFYA